MKRFLELNDGSKWLPNGVGQYPYRKWDFKSLEPYSQEHADELRYKTILQEIKSTKFEDLDSESLEKIIKIIKEKK